jgi:hypothetical protein
VAVPGAAALTTHDDFWNLVIIRRHLSSFVAVLAAAMMTFDDKPQHRAPAGIDALAGVARDKTCRRAPQNKSGT